jgi:hypothetical protein
MVNKYRINDKLRITEINIKHHHKEEKLRNPQHALSPSPPQTNKQTNK